MHQQDLNSKRIVASQLLAYSFLKLFPNAKLKGGSSFSLGFYYDFQVEQPLTTNALEMIEVNLKTLIKEDLPITFSGMMRENAENFFTHQQQEFLADLAASHDCNIIELIRVEEFSAICQELPITSTNQIGAVKLLTIETDETRKNVRVIGTAFDNSQDLKQFVKRYDKMLRKGDHRQLAQAMKLYLIQANLSNLEPILLPNGLKLRETLQKWISTSRFFDQFLTVSSPVILNKSKQHDADHFYQFTMDDEDHILNYDKTYQHFEVIRSLVKAGYTLPVRINEWGRFYQHQDEVDLWGMFSSESFFGQEGMICCFDKDLSKQLTSCLLFIEQIVTIFDFKAQWAIIRPRQKKIKERFEKEAFEIFERLKAKSKYPFVEDEYRESELVESPTLELLIEDEIGREWPAGRMSILLQKKAQDLIRDCKEEANLVSFSLLGSLDRFVALLLERYQGELPLWLAPVQVRILVVGKSGMDFAREVYGLCVANNIRTEIDIRDVKLNEKVHEALKEKVPYLLIIGEQEAKSKKISLQSAKQIGRKQLLGLEELLVQIKSELEIPVLN